LSGRQRLAILFAGGSIDPFILTREEAAGTPLRDDGRVPCGASRLPTAVNVGETLALVSLQQTAAACHAPPVLCGPLGSLRERCSRPRTVAARRCGR